MVQEIIFAASAQKTESIDDGTFEHHAQNNGEKMENVNNVNESKEEDKSGRGPSISHKDVQLEFLSKGTQGVRMRYAGQVSAKVVSRAIEELSERNGVDADDLDALRAFVDEIAPANNSTGRGRGKQPPAVGDVRLYKAQSIKKGPPFLRLALETIGLGKGEQAKVSFEPGRIVVTNPSADSE